MNNMNIINIVNIMTIMKILNIMNIMDIMVQKINHECLLIFLPVSFIIPQINPNGMPGHGLDLRYLFISLYFLVQNTLFLLPFLFKKST